jgi:hypothetical protein
LPLNTYSLLHRFCSTKSAKATLAPYKYFALEFGVDCRCGNAYKHTLVKKTCKTPCSGNNKQQCGGAGAVDVWVNSDYIDGSAGGGSTGGSGSVSSIPLDRLRSLALHMS